MPISPRIVSLVPSWTETVYHLGKGTSLIGRTRFCIHPDAVKRVPKVGGTKEIDIDKIIALAPDIVIANKEENVKEQVEKLQVAGLDVWVSDVTDYHTALDEIVDLGKKISAEKEAISLSANISKGLQGMALVPTILSCCYLIWKNPYMTIGGDTYISSILDLMGYTNVYKHEKRYPEVDMEELQRMAPDVIFLSSEPYPFVEKHALELYDQLGIPVVLVDGEVFSWYGSKMLDIPSYSELLRTKIDAL